MSTHRFWGALLASMLAAGVSWSVTAGAADCNSNGVDDAVDLTQPVLRADLPVPFKSLGAWGPPLVVDLNGDGNLDLLALEGAFVGGDSYAVWINSGAGVFAGPTRYFSGRGGTWITATDLDGDGAPDVAAIAAGVRNFVLSRNDGAGHFAEPGRIFVDRYFFVLGNGDFNGDGRNDLVSGHSEGVTVHINNGAADFELHQDSGPQTRVQRLAAADLEGDGDLDLAILADIAEELVVLANGGDATFKVAATHELAGLLTTVAFADLDNDGDGDVAALWAGFLPGGLLEGRLSLYTNDGQGALTPEGPHRFSITNPPRHLELADADQDGDTDLLVSAEDLLLLRRSGGDWHVPETLATDANIGFFATGDLDADGTSELWTATQDAPASLGVVSLAVAPWSIDCDRDGIPDECGIDCNHNHRADTCDVTDSPDCNANGIPDLCDPDCNENGIPDDCDLVQGTSPDCNSNGLPDECEPADCNDNGIPDDCDITAGRSQDCNENRRPDECEGDCNSSGLPDDCDVARGTSQDANGNSVPDECEVEPSFVYDFLVTRDGQGAPGALGRVEVGSRLHIVGLAPGVVGTQGWSLFAAATGCVPITATTAGTAAAEVTDDPPGFVTRGFRHIRLVPRQEMLRLDLAYDGGYTSAIVLSFQEPVSLDPAGSPYLVARATLEGLVPAMGCASCALEYSEFRSPTFGDGAGGTGGLPAGNVVTFRGMTVGVRRLASSVRFCEAQFHRGDANGDGRNDVSDAVAIFAFLFLGSARPGCLEAANTDDSSVVDISDGISLLNFLFLGGVAPPPPGSSTRGPCGPDPGGAQGNLGCERYDGCR